MMMMTMVQLCTVGHVCLNFNPQMEAVMQYKDYMPM